MEVETLAAELPAEMPTGPEKQRLLSVLVRTNRDIQKAVDADEQARVRHLNMEYHRAIHAAVNPQILMTVTEPIWRTFPSPTRWLGKWPRQMKR
jgi:DNA-binding GntR family transcriptional regulator